jgi:hypothetical protein
VRVTLSVLTQSPVTPGFGEQMLPTPDALHYGERDIAGFRQASDSYYTGEWVWTPGIQLYSALFPILNLSKWLTLPALVWALFSRKWFYVTAAVLLLVAAASLSAVDAPEPRIYAAVYPLWTILIGGMIAALWHRLKRQ